MSHPQPSSPLVASVGMVSLSRLRGGERGRLDLSALCCDECDLLNAMGLTDQCEVRVCRTGEPCIVQVHSTRLGLSAELAQKILVTVHTAQGSEAAAQSPRP
jgi:Fe2+ transport system protein FeoA